MAFLDKYGGSALKYYQDILSAAYNNVSNTDMWNTIRSSAARYGFPSPQTQPPDVSKIRGWANKIVAGAQAFAAASPSDTITRDMMSYAPYSSRNAASIDTNPIYQVRYQNIIQASDGTISTVWSTSVYNAVNMPATVGGLVDAINTDAEEWAAQAAQQTAGESGGTSLGTQGHEITLV